MEPEILLGLRAKERECNLITNQAVESVCEEESVCY